MSYHIRYSDISYHSAGLPVPYNRAPERDRCAIRSEKERLIERQANCHRQKARHKADTRQTHDRHKTDTRQTQGRHKIDTRQTHDRHKTDTPLTEMDRLERQIHGKYFTTMNPPPSSFSASTSLSACPFNNSSSASSASSSSPLSFARGENERPGGSSHATHALSWSVRRGGANVITRRTSCYRQE
jgi:hypothetical protein